MKYSKKTLEKIIIDNVVADYAKNAYEKAKLEAFLKENAILFGKLVSKEDIYCMEAANLLSRHNRGTKFYIWKKLNKKSTKYNKALEELWNNFENKFFIKTCCQ